MSKNNALNPNDVLDALRATSTRRQKVSNLELLHELCAAQQAGSRDFSLPTIGRLWEAAGGIKARALYNAASADYRTLIAAWEKHSGPAPRKDAEPKGAKQSAFLEKIEDPAVRALVQGALIERDKLQAEVNLLKSATMLQLDRSPPMLAGPATTQVGPLSPVLPSPTAAPALTTSEREALEHAVSPVFLEDQGWTEKRSGEVVNDKGRRIFEAGFTKAIRKVLAR